MSISSHFSKNWISYAVVLVAACVFGYIAAPKILANRASKLAEKEMSLGHPGIAEDLVDPYRHTLAASAYGCKILLPLYQSTNDLPRERWASEICERFKLQASSANAPLPSASEIPKQTVVVPAPGAPPLPRPPAFGKSQERAIPNLGGSPNVGKQSGQNLSPSRISQPDPQKLLKAAKENSITNPMIAGQLYMHAIMSAPNNKAVVTEGLNGLLSHKVAVPVGGNMLGTIISKDLKADPEVKKLLEKLGSR